MATVIQPLNYGFALTATSVVVLQPNDTRTALRFHNPNASHNIWVAPAGTSAAQNGAGSYEIASGTFLDFSTLFPATTCGWNACMDSGQTGNLSILEWIS